MAVRGGDRSGILDAIASMLDSAGASSFDLRLSRLNPS